MLWNCNIFQSLVGTALDAMPGVAAVGRAQEAVGGGKLPDRPEEGCCSLSWIGRMTGKEVWRGYHARSWASSNKIFELCPGGIPKMDDSRRALGPGAEVLVKLVRMGMICDFRFGFAQKTLGFGSAGEQSGGVVRDVESARICLRIRISGQRVYIEFGAWGMTMMVIQDRNVESDDATRRRKA